ncbi:MAG: 16S rRNA (cytosine(1402)-N(4))-methyltransferase RsmH [Candidatus Falkowbacteria bacterium]|nr:16S rRNA (cytosine(1402)-N(4))-methyltransferase RsmH [Candidatus Falkowbacteria bacterium]
MEYKHIPVMLDEVIEYLKLKKSGFYIDCTLGGGGYTFAIASKIGATGKILAIDLDSLAIENTKENIKAKNLNNIILAQDNFNNLENIVQEKFNKDQKFDGIVLDLGLSSAQLEDRARGFSFKSETPLDMAFEGNQTERGSKTEHIVNYYKEAELERIIKDYGEERFARNIASAIVKSRKEKSIKTTLDLAQIIDRAIPIKFQSKSIHPATKTFQALRIETNKELESLEKVMPAAVKLLSKNGRIVIVSYHSLEDRIVKQFFRAESLDCICPKEIPLCVCEHKPNLKIITKKPLTPKEPELNKNHRARSAKLRVAQKIT